MKSLYRDRLIVAVLILGVCCFALTPALYLVSRALHWDATLEFVEILFFPSFLLFGAGGLFAYRRNKARRQLRDEEPPNDQF